MTDTNVNVQADSLLNVSSAPHLRDKTSTKSLMLDVIISLVPTCLAGIYFFGYRAGISMAVAVIGAVLAEYVFEKAIGKKTSIGDLSAAVTGLLLALNVPVSMPYWQTFLGSVFAIVIVKQCFGGLGSNFMNPALAARAIMMISFGRNMSSFTGPHTDMVSMATPLSDGPIPSYMEMFLGNMPGTLGEVSKLAILIGAAYLIVKKVISLEIPLIYIGSTLATIFIATKGQADLLFHLLSGGLIFGAVFMATDYATSPVSKKGKVIFALGLGILTAIIRVFGGNPEGVCYSILIMNMFVPLIDRFTQERVYGIGGKA